MCPKTMNDNENRATVLVCEDEFVVALDLKLLIEEFGFQVMGPFAKRADALEKLDQNLPDVALLDVRLKDGEVFPLADKLVDLGVPIVFHSGHIFEEDVRNRYPGAETCQKPVSAKHLRTTLENAR
ncbi:MAG: response regulator [Roseovarius indicus]